MRYKIERSLSTGARYPWLVLDAEVGEVVASFRTWAEAVRSVTRAVVVRALTMEGRW